MHSIFSITPEEMAAYRAAHRRRRQEEREVLDCRYVRAWALAKQASKLLRERFGAARVVVFGSLTRKDAFNMWSDVDIAAWGLRPEDTFRAMGAVMDLDPQIQLNLVDVSTCSSSFLASIQKEGIEL